MKKHQKTRWPGPKNKQQHAQRMKPIPLMKIDLTAWKPAHDLPTDLPFSGQEAQDGQAKTV